MRSTDKIFHLAIPVIDLEESYDFYVKGLGCKLARRYDDRITLDFFGDQVVCHLSPNSCDKKASFYPRHFGITFEKILSYEQLLSLSRLRKLNFFLEPCERFTDLAESHKLFALLDPSNNVLEFKHYDDPRMMY